MSLFERTIISVKPIFLIAAMISAAFSLAVPVTANTVVLETQTSDLGVVRGIVRDNSGSPIADATVAIFRLGTSKVLKQVRYAADGSFLAKIMPGTYTILAVAQGYNPVTLPQVEVGQSTQFTYGFKLERAGSGNTLPEKRLDRNSPKWVIRSAQTSRSIYQNSEGEIPEVDAVESADTAALEDESGSRKAQTVVETYFSSSESGPTTGINVATLLPVNENTELILAGQAGIGRNAPQRIEVQAKFRPHDNHQIRLNTSIGNLGGITIGEDEKSLGQFSFQGLDEWRVREGIIFVFGVDYARFIGAGSDQSISPRLGLQFDLNSKTRFRSAYTTNTEERTWAKAIELEDAQVIFREPAAIDDLVIEDGKPQLNKSRRLEFGVERVLDNKSSIEANAFFDTTLGRGVAFTDLSFTGASSPLGDFVGNQQGNARGVSIVYNRRLNGSLSTAAGYSFGSGQSISEEGITNPAELFKTDFFQSFFGQFEADLSTGTNVKTIFRLSPQATVFAIDPFQGRLAIYDPSLSILVTQSLPNLGLPFRAEATVDARNLFDFQTGLNGEDGGLRVNSQRRAVRGAISLRF